MLTFDERVSSNIKSFIIQHARHNEADYELRVKHSFNSDEFIAKYIIINNIAVIIFFLKQDFKIQLAK